MQREDFILRNKDLRWKFCKRVLHVSTNSSIFFSSYACVVNFIYLTTGEDSQNAAENSYGDAGSEQFSVRHLS